MLKLCDSGQITEETSSDYEWPFTDYWWKFICPACGDIIYYFHGYSILKKGTKVKCDTCKKSYRTKDSYTCGKEKKPFG